MLDPVEKVFIPINAETGVSLFTITDLRIQMFWKKTVINGVRLGSCVRCLEFIVQLLTFPIGEVRVQIKAFLCGCSPTY